ncbi:tRNA glutamyl-Q(34) synthetase GluQRS [Rhizobium paknamense]|uniref:Glutamyl-Q tRNA(Asp) synthetase n=1 Tax=Rhizobium paknamense TaxID=1206817 RepID=A0ABU0IE50_9HYPH|nr:tRNA glutamyl-Q(34) synthetase GluQRS [Rhizobium paknamense]MDQ0456525.1 glutamyl-Q tRNA(Asp) synthetase [Rhizobium paknamense]
MTAPPRQNPCFRFAPSPNGFLHLGHALSALLNAERAKACGGRFLLRIEDIDPGRSTPEFEAAIYEDLAWLGLSWEMPVRRQSEHIDSYRDALARLQAMGLVYPAFLSRSDIKAEAQAFEAQGGRWPRDPDGALHYPLQERGLDPAEAARRIKAGARHALRLNMARALSRIDAPLLWTETGSGNVERIAADPAAWGDVILWRWDAPSSYHLSVVVDDALQGITEVVRGRDLYHATSVQRLLQALLGIAPPVYHHHRLVLGADGRKLSKSEGSAGIRQLRAEGRSPADLRRILGFVA